MDVKEKNDLTYSIESVLQITSAKWTVPILNNLVGGPCRPAELAKLLRGINPKMLTERLRELEKWDLIDRKEYKEIPPRVEYSLTLRGRELLQALSPLQELSQRWLNIFSFGVNGSESSVDTNGSDDVGLSERISTAKVYLVGLGPGASDLISLRAVKILSEADLVIYSASRVQETAFEHFSADAELINLDTFTLEEQLEHYLYIKEKCLTAARLYSGDPSIFASINEQVDILNELNIEYEIIPGIASFTAAAASIGCSLTQVPDCESIILTNLPARAKSQRAGQSKKEDLEKIERLAVHRTAMCIYLYGSQIAEALLSLSKHYPQETPVALVSAALRLDERKYVGTLESILTDIKMSEWDWQGSAVMIVGDVLQAVTKSASSRELA